MDLTVIRGLGPARREKLEAAGISTVAALADADVDRLTDEVGLAASLIKDFQGQAKDLLQLNAIEGIPSDAIDRLVEADVRSPGDLADAELTDLSDATGIAKRDLETWQRRARPLAAKKRAQDKAAEVAHLAKAAGTRVQGSFEDARVVLREGITDARIKVERDVLAEAKILPIRARDNLDMMLDRVKGNVVILREKADTAVVRIEDTVVEGLPIFKERLDQAAERATKEADEVRVRVQEIRDKRVLPEARKLKDRVGSLFGRGKRGNGST